MLEIPNDQFQLEPIYKPIPVGIWVNWLESRREHVGKKKKKQIQRKIWKLQTTGSQKVSSSICLLGAQFPFQVRIKGFILTLSFQNDFFRQTKCKLSRVPNIPNYCSSYKTLSSLKLFLDLAWMLQPNDSWVQPVLTVGTSREELRQETGNRDRKRNKLHRLCAWRLGIVFFSHSFTWIQLEVPKWNRSIETSDFSPIFILLFKWKTIPSCDPVCRVPTFQYPEYLPTWSIFPNPPLNVWQFQWHTRTLQNIHCSHEIRGEGLGLSSHQWWTFQTTSWSELQ